MTTPAGDVKEIFGKALELAPAERAAYLEQACGGNAELLAEVQGLLKALDAAGPFLNRPGKPAGEQTTDHVGETPGTIIAGRYKLLEELGAGGMGAVWVAEQVQPVRRKVAIKLIKPGMDTRQVLSRFEAERQALALMDHPNIAKVLDGGRTEQGRPFFVMEYVKGVPITRYADDARLTVRERLELFIPVCQAVQHAHQKGVIHRDLKPSNILICLYDGKPVPKVIDFGLAKALHQPLTEHTLYTAHGMMLGTPLYMSPEQAEFNNLDVDTRTDVYSLGVLLYELLTGTTPLEKQHFKESAWQEIIRLIKEVDPPRPSNRLSGSGSLPSVAAQRRAEPLKLSKLVRGELDWIVMKALEKDRSRRYETANGLARDIERYLHDEAVEACPPSAAYRLRKLARKYRTPLRAAAVCVMLLIAGVAASTWQAIRATRAEAAALAERDEKEQARQAEAREREQTEIARNRAVRAEAEAKGERDKAIAERQRADEQAAIALAVNDFLQKDLLGQADVGNQPGGGQARDPDVKVRTLLDRAAQTIKGKFEDQPLTEAAVRFTLGGTFRGLGEFTKARQQLEQSIKLRATHLGVDHLDTLASKAELGLVYVFMADNDESAKNSAEPLLQEVLNAYLAKLGSAHRDTQSVKLVMAWLRRRQNKRDEAEALLHEVLQAQSNFKPDDPLVLDTKRSLAALHMDRGDYDRAERIIQEMIGTAAASLGNDHPMVIVGKTDLAYLYGPHQRKYAQAEAIYREMLQSKAFPGGVQSETKRALAGLYGAQKRYDLAEPLWRELTAADQQRDGGESQAYISDVEGLCGTLVLQRKYAEAEPLLRKLVDIQARREPDQWTFETRGLLGAVLLAEKRYAEAEPLLVQCYEGMKQRQTELAADNLAEDTGIRFQTHTLENLIQLYAAWGNPKQAARWREEREQSVRGYVRRWLVLTEPIPYHESDGTKAVDATQVAGEAGLRPRPGDEFEAGGRRLGWKEYSTPERFVDFTAIYGMPNHRRVAYAVCYVISSAERTGLGLRVGSDDQAKVYLNGREVHRVAKTRPLRLDEDDVQGITLRNGTNVLVLKVVNESFDWAGSIRFVEKDGKPAEGLEFRLTQ
jgi:non-specific serine/threonine protein kinase/serine/threonine-protein kinase